MWIGSPNPEIGTVSPGASWAEREKEKCDPNHAAEHLCSSEKITRLFKKAGLFLFEKHFYDNFTHEDTITELKPQARERARKFFVVAKF